MDQPTAEQALRQLESLVGEWAFEARWPSGEMWPVGGRVTFEVQEEARLAEELFAQAAHYRVGTRCHFATRRGARPQPLNAQVNQVLGTVAPPPPHVPCSGPSLVGVAPSVYLISNWLPMVDMKLERLNGLQPLARVKGRAAFEQAEDEGLGVMVVSGLRTFKEQDALYALGRTKPHKQIVTNARAGQSYHNFGLAFDFAVARQVQSKTLAVWDAGHPHWKRFVRIAKSHGFDWGGDFGDNPHFEIKPPSITSLRAKYPTGYSPEGAEVQETPRDRLPLKRGHIDGEKKLVSELQRRLGIRVNGRFGKRTEAAVIEWQAVHNERGEVVAVGKGLSIDGRVGRKTWEALSVG